MGRVLCCCADVRRKKAARIKQSAYCVDPEYGSSAHGPKAHAHTYQPFSHHISASYGIKTNHQRTQDGHLLMQMLRCVLTGGWPNTTYLFHESYPVFDLVQFNSCIGKDNMTDEANFFGLEAGTNLDASADAFRRGYGEDGVQRQ